MSTPVSNKTFMSPYFLTKFLQQYRDLPVLWQVRSAEYSNKAKRDEAWNVLVNFTRARIPDADLCFVKKKVDSIRASFRKELRRVRCSKRTSAQGVYKPTLWYFALLLFTADQENTRRSKSNFDEDGDSQETTDEAGQGEITQTLQTSNMVPKRKNICAKPSTIVHAGGVQRQNRIKKAMAVFSKQDDEYDTLGKTYAAKLRRMPPAQRDIADKLINEVLFKGLQTHLTPATFISDYGSTSGGWMSIDTPSPAATHSPKL